ncbi:MAG: hypothetical protein U0326_38985 [Polyangiales bacterium]
MTVDEREIRAVICAVRPAGDYTADDLRVATTAAFEGTLGRPLDAPEAAEVARVVSQWFSEMCLAEAFAQLEAGEG